RVDALAPAGHGGLGRPGQSGRVGGQPRMVTGSSLAVEAHLHPPDVRHDVMLAPGRAGWAVPRVTGRAPAASVKTCRSRRLTARPPWSWTARPGPSSCWS